MTLQDILGEYLTRRNITGREFARNCNGKISYPYIANIIRGYSPSTGEPPKVSNEKLKIIAEGMGITFEELLDMMNDRPIKESYAPNARPEHGVLITAPREETFSQEFIDRLAEKLNVGLDEKINKSINERISQNPEIQPRKYKMLSAGALTLTDEQLDKVYAMAHLMYPDTFPLEEKERKEGQ